MRHDHPDWPTNPYPDHWSEITGFAYRSALSLIRPLNTVPFRLGEDGDYVLQYPFEIDYRLDRGDWRRLTVPQGLITDLTSAPRLLRVFVGRVGPWLEAAIIHDYLYIAWQDVPGLGPRSSDRYFADRMMLKAMEAADVGALQRQAIYRFVRTFGASAYARQNADRYAELGARARFRSGFPTSRPSVGDAVNSRSTPRVTSPDSAEREPAAPHGTMPLQRLERVGRAGGLKPAGVSDPGREG